jgi:hypothetical protein
MPASARLAQAHQRFLDSLANRLMRRGKTGADLVALDDQADFNAAEFWRVEHQIGLLACLGDNPGKLLLDFLRPSGLVKRGRDTNLPRLCGGRYVWCCGVACMAMPSAVELMRSSTGRNSRLRVRKFGRQGRFAGCRQNLPLQRQDWQAEPACRSMPATTATGRRCRRQLRCEPLTATCESRRWRDGDRPATSTATRGFDAAVGRVAGRIGCTAGGIAWWWRRISIPDCTVRAGYSPAPVSAFIVLGDGNGGSAGGSSQECASAFSASSGFPRETGVKPGCCQHAATSSAGAIRSGEPGSTGSDFAGSSVLAGCDFAFSTLGKTAGCRAWAGAKSLQGLSGARFRGAGRLAYLKHGQLRVSSVGRTCVSPCGAAVMMLATARPVPIFQAAAPALERSAHQVGEQIGLCAFFSAWRRAPCSSFNASVRALFVAGDHGTMPIGQGIEGTYAALFADPVLLAGQGALLGQRYRLGGGHDRVVDARQESAVVTPFGGAHAVFARRRGTGLVLVAVLRQDCQSRDASCSPAISCPSSRVASSRRSFDRSSKRLEMKRRAT